MPKEEIKVEMPSPAEAVTKRKSGNTQYVRNWRVKHPHAVEVLDKASAEAKYLKRAEKPSAHFVSHAGMLVLSASHGQEDRRHYVKGSPCFGMALMATLHPIDPIKWKRATLHSIMGDGYIAYRRIIERNGGENRDSDYCIHLRLSRIPGRLGKKMLRWRQRQWACRSAPLFSASLPTRRHESSW